MLEDRGLVCINLFRCSTERLFTWTGSAMLQRETIFSSLVQMYRKTYCIIPGTGLDIGVSKNVKFMC